MPFYYWRRGFEDIPFGLVGTGSKSIQLAGLAATRTHTDVLVRTRLYLSLNFVVGNQSADSPPERWWANNPVTVSTTFTPDGSALWALPDSGDSRIVCTGALFPTLVASPSDPTAYAVTYQPKDGVMESFSRRKSDGVHFGRAQTLIHMGDYDAGWWLGTYSAIDASVGALVEYLYASPSPS